jgi:hypothetical protein
MYTKGARAVAKKAITVSAIVPVDASFPCEACLFVVSRCVG